MALWSHLILAFILIVGNYDIGVYSGNQLCRVTGGATVLFSYNNTWNQNTLSSAEKALTQEQCYLDIYKTMQNEYKNFKYLIHDDDKLQKYFVVSDDGTGNLIVKKLDLLKKTDENYLTYTNFNLLALIDYATKNYPMLDKQINELQEIVINNQKISLIDANQIIYDNEVFIENYLTNQ